MGDNLADLSAVGVSIWLDDLTRTRLTSGSLAALVADSHVVGVTTNPTIFDQALRGGSDAYAAQIHDLAVRGVSVDEAIRAITTFDVRWACDVLAGPYHASDGVDGRVSIEVDPRLARDAVATGAEAAALAWLVDRPQLLVKIPATEQGLPAITETLARGISVNVTLIFSLERYRAVIDAWLTGMEQAVANGRDIAGISSVASFFVSRVDSEVDRRLPEDSPLRGQAAIANARLAYEVFQDVLARPRWKALEDQGARPQRPLWASTGVKDPKYPDTRYVLDLATPGTVNTMPEATLDAVRDHGASTGDRVLGQIEAAHATFEALAAAGVDLDDVTDTLEREGVQKFVDSWDHLMSTVRASLDAARPAGS